MAPSATLDTAWLARALPAVWLGGSATLLAILLGGGAGEGSSTALYVVDGVGWVVALALLGGAGRARHFFELTQYIGIAVVTALVAFSGDPATPFALFFFLLAVQAAYFEHWRRAVPQAIAAGGGYAIGLAVASGGSIPWVRWLLMGMTLCTIGALVAYLRAQMGLLVARLSEAADTDELTGLGNRRRLLVELERAVASATPEAPVTLAMFDLDGFKAYNDTFGHPAGDALLMRMGARLNEAARPLGRAYRLGGDEFCLIAQGDAADRAGAIQRASSALTERGEGFEIGAPCGRAEIPHEADSGATALSVADGRLYQQKIVGQPGRARLVARMAPESGDHDEAVALALRLGARMGVEGEDLDVLARAAQLQNIGKIAIPEDLLATEGPFSTHELELLRRHVLIGERLLQATEPLGPVARIVRASRERWDGKGYPDGRAGADIPLASRIIAVSQAFHMLTTPGSPRGERTPGAALTELSRAAGTRFDPYVVQALAALLEEDLRNAGSPASSAARAG